MFIFNANVAIKGVKIKSTDMVRTSRPIEHINLLGFDLILRKN